MNRTDLTLAYSTCPNDTFIFHAMVHGLVPLNGLEYSVFLEDVESLNKKAETCFYHISKLSFAAIAQHLDSYRLLKSGAALGRGCGPLIVMRKGSEKKKFKDAKIAVPGFKTTANLLFSLFTEGKVNRNNICPLVFDQIMPSVSSGMCDYGVIIHEGRFTYKNWNLELVQDLGAWWEEETSLPIPLGGIAVKRDIPESVSEIIETTISDSVLYGFSHRKASEEYIKKHAQELEDSVIFQHIDLYVNDFTVNLGNEGERAITYLFDMAKKHGLIKQIKSPFLNT